MFLYRKFVALMLLVGWSFSSFAQANQDLKSGPSFAKQGTHWLNLNFGLSFMNSDVANFDDPFLMMGENRRNFGIIAQPKFQVFLKDRLGIGFHLGSGLDEFENENINFKQNRYNYFAGLQTEYYFFIPSDFFLVSAEIDASLHYLDEQVNTSAAEVMDRSSTYFKSGLHLNLNFVVHDNWVVYAKFYDVFSYTTSANNFFDYGKGFKLNNSLQNFIHFPQFGVLWKLF